MDAKLAEYRAKRRRQELIEDAKIKVKNFFAAGVKAKEEPMDNFGNEEQEPMLPPPGVPAAAPTFLSGRRNMVLAGDEEAWDAEDVEEEGLWSKRLRRGTTVILVMMWTALFLVSVQLGLALAFCLITAIFLIFTCTRTRPRKPGEPSAYSVFNPNCQSIDGTLNAEQFEREIRYGPTSVHR